MRRHRFGERPLCRGRSRPSALLVSTSFKPYGLPSPRALHKSQSQAYQVGFDMEGEDVLDDDDLFWWTRRGRLRPPYTDSRVTMKRHEYDLLIVTLM